MKNFFQTVFSGIGIGCGFIFATFLSLIVGYIFGAKVGQCTSSKATETSYANLGFYFENEMTISNALLNGLHWCMINDTSLWKSSFMKTEEYKNIDTLVQWDDFYDIDWKAKESPSYEDLEFFHK